MNLILGGDVSNYGSLAMIRVAHQELSGECICYTHVKNNGIRGSGNFITLKHYRLRLLLLALLIPKGWGKLLITRPSFHFLSDFIEADRVFDVSGFAWSDKFKPVTFFRYFLPIFLALKYRKKVTLCPQSFGPFSNYRHKLISGLVKHFVSRGQLIIYSRDNSSHQNLIGLGINNLRVMDSVFSYRLIQKSGADNPRSIGVVLNSHVFNRHNEIDVLELYQFILSQLVALNRKVVIFSHTKSADSHVNGVIANECRRLGLQYEVKGGDLTIEELAEVYEGTEYVITSRFHSAVFAAAKGVPAVLVGWSDKYDELANEYGFLSMTLPLTALGRAEFTCYTDTIGTRRKTLVALVSKKRQYAMAQTKEVYSIK